MKILIVYDSAFGNTEEIAIAIGEALGLKKYIDVIKAFEVTSEHYKRIKYLNLLIVGSPTQKFSPIGGINSFIKNIPKNSLKGVKVAAFDTRFTENEIEKIRILAFFVKIFGYAAKKIADKLIKKGGMLIAPPEGFFVQDTEGPLLDGELERARRWAKQIGSAK